MGGAYDTVPQTLLIKAGIGEVGGAGTGRGLSFLQDFHWIVVDTATGPSSKERDPVFAFWSSAGSYGHTSVLRSVVLAAVCGGGGRETAGSCQVVDLCGHYAALKRV